MHSKELRIATTLQIEASARPVALSVPGKLPTDLRKHLEKCGPYLESKGRSQVSIQGKLEVENGLI